MNSFYTEEVTIITRDDIHIMLDKSQALDQLLGDIKAGVVAIVPVKMTEEMDNKFESHMGRFNWGIWIESAPEYEPLKEWLK